MSKKVLYRVIFSHLDAIYEIYARYVTESDLFGFVVVEDFVFGENASLVVDPSEERLKIEFADVKRTFIPMQSIFRIDEVNKEGVAKVREKTGESNKVTVFTPRGKPT
jgi:hypothetical protein